MDMYRQVILAVDDDPDMLTLLDTMLKRRGYVVMKARNAEIALHLIKSFSPNLLVLDVLMPNMDGFELCERIRNIPHTANIPIIILTALNTANTRQQAINVGANAFIAKDDLFSDLAAEIQRLLSNGTGQSSGSTAVI
jgi:CheY-like chemotaxis protein